jgi:hypothetical protein
MLLCVGVFSLLACVWRITDFPRISNSPHTGRRLRADAGVVELCRFRSDAAAVLDLLADLVRAAVAGLRSYRASLRCTRLLRRVPAGDSFAFAGLVFGFWVRRCTRRRRLCLPARSNVGRCRQVRNRERTRQFAQTFWLRGEASGLLQTDRQEHSQFELSGNLSGVPSIKKNFCSARPPHVVAKIA